MTENKRKISFARVLAVISVITLFHSLYLTVNETAKLLSNKNELAKAQQRLQEVQDVNAELTAKKKKFQDPDYVGVYARGKFLISKEGEQIFVLPIPEGNQE